MSQVEFRQAYKFVKVLSVLVRRYLLHLMLVRLPHAETLFLVLQVLLSIHLNKTTCGDGRILSVHLLIEKQFQPNLEFILLLISVGGG